MKPLSSGATLLNVYDSVNRNRILGTHPRWSGCDKWRKFYIAPRMATVGYGCEPFNVEVSQVELQREVIVSNDGWSAEVALVTYSPL